MGLRFRRSFRVAPGIRLNFSGSGASVSVEPRGASVTFGRRGTYVNTGIPRTGLYSRSKVGGRAAPGRPCHGTERTTKRIQAAIEDDGTIKFLDVNGEPLSQDWINRAKRQMGDEIRDLIERTCDRINAAVEALGTIYLQTPAPHERLRYEPREFDTPRPKEPAQRPHGILGWLFKSRRKRIDSENAMRRSDYQKALGSWDAERARFVEAERRRKILLEERVLADVDAMEEILESALQDISWPRETAVSAEINDGGRTVLVDVDLPEIEDMPKTQASAPSRGYKLTVKELSASKLQKLYMQHVHGIGFRVIGESFAVLPTAQEVVLSAFSQRADKATGTVSDEYLYSVRAKRPDWAQINFANLEELDVIAALERFELRRDMSKSGLFRPVEPIPA